MSCKEAKIETAEKELLRLIMDYHTLEYDQIMQIFGKNEELVKKLLDGMVKEGKVYYDRERRLICDSSQSAEKPDLGTIAAFWVLLSFKRAIIYNVDEKVPVKLRFRSRGEVYETIYADSGQETMLNRAFENKPIEGTNRLVIVGSENQLAKINIAGVAAYCMVGKDGTVSYYQKREAS
jgi:hypothetical protein